MKLSCSGLQPATCNLEDTWNFSSGVNSSVLTCIKCQRISNT